MRESACVAAGHVQQVVGGDGHQDGRHDRQVRILLVIIGWFSTFQEIQTCRHNRQVRIRPRDDWLNTSLNTIICQYVFVNMRCKEEKCDSSFTQVQMRVLSAIARSLEPFIC